MKGICSSCAEYYDLVDDTNLCQGCYDKYESILENMDEEEYQKFERENT